ncbi:MAG: RDD family protein [Candidatus Thermoplasmatota archaeon]|nr:RDD family protein [Candidatus Thermoplasmatota archaeon]
MALDPLLQEYRYEIKENRGRRALALLVDTLIVAVFVFFFTAIFIFIVFESNPLSLIVGQFSPLIYHHETVMGRPTPVVLAMIPGIFLSLIFTGLYFTIFEVNGRRTLGKSLLHLEALGSDGKYLNWSMAYRRNLTKHIFGAAGIYILGIFGFGLFIGIACLVDLMIYPQKKRDVRQRLSEVSLGTMVYVENETIPIGGISIPGEKIPEIKEKVKAPKSEGSRPLSGPEKPLSLPAFDEKERADQTSSKKKPLLLAPAKGSEGPSEKEHEEGPSPEVKDEEVGEEDKIIEEKQSVSFISRIFKGVLGSRKEKGDTTLHIEQVPGPDDITDIEGPKIKKETARDENLLRFMMEFDIDEVRAGALYDMGYRSKADLIDAVPQDLMMIEGINPTIAKRIIARAKE